MDKHISKKKKQEFITSFRYLFFYCLKKIKHFIAAFICYILALAILLVVTLPIISNIIQYNFDAQELSFDFNILQIIVLTVYLFLIFFIAFFIKVAIIPNAGKQRNAQAVIKSLSSNDTRTPATNRQDLLNRIAGDNINSDTQIELNRVIDNNIEQIKNFILNDEKTLLVNGKWGTGKTTYTLIAIDEVCDNKKFSDTDYRFIYESSFKYISGFNEFKKDILKVIKSILSEQNIFSTISFSELLANIGSSTTGIKLPKYETNRNTTDIIDSLNIKYRKKKGSNNIDPFKIILVIDDIDRLQGEEIIHTLAFLSILRRLDFVKIIIPIDRNVVVDQLKVLKVTEPQIYINKYLPEQSSIEVQSDFNIINNIFAKKIKKELGTYCSESQVTPILECFYTKAFSNRLKQNMEGAHVYNLGEWPYSGCEYKYYSEALTQDDEYNSVYIFDAPDFLYNNLPHEDRTKFSFTNRESTFESIIYLIKFKNKRPKDDGSPLRVDEELYAKCIHSWIIAFTEQKWEELNLSIRELDDIFNRYICEIKKDITSDMLPHNIFVKTFNVIFSNKKITDEMKYEDESQNNPRQTVL